MKASPAIRAALKGHDPTEEQWAAITHPLTPVHLIAAAGSGKTAVMAARIVWAIEDQGYTPLQVLGLTFTNKAAGELEERVREALGHVEPAGIGEVAISTYHAFAAEVVREHGLLAGVEPGAGLLTQAQQYQLVLTCLDDLPAFEALELRSGGGIAKATIEMASALADHIASVGEIEAAAQRVLSGDAADGLPETAAKRLDLCRAVAAYITAKHSVNRIDFGDQITKAVALLEEYDEVRNRYRERFPVVLLDEYQDTNVAQRRLIQALVVSGGAVTAVGDARQAIYAFRGATMYNLIGFPGHFPRNGRDDYPSISLSENFRSGRRILAVANTVIERIDESRRPGKPLQHHAANGEGRVELGLFDDEHKEVAWIAARIQELHGTSVSPGRPEVRWKDVAVLVRRKATMDAILEALAEADIPVEAVGLAGLLKTPEVTEVVAWLRSLDPRPSANRWLARVLMGPRWRVHYKDLALLARWAAGRNWELRLKLAGGDEERAMDLEPGEVGFSLAETLDHLDEIEGLGPEARRRLGQFRSILGELRDHLGASLPELVQEVIRVSGIADALESSAGRGAESARRNLTAFLDLVEGFSPLEGEINLQAFVAFLEAADEAEDTMEPAQPAESDSVKLMTVHQAKGLEFECVFVPSVAAAKGREGSHIYSVFPNTRASNPLESYRELPYEVREDRAFLPEWTTTLAKFREDVRLRALEDERRLFYVALTRAQQHLAVTAAWWYGRDKRAKGPSLFYEELAEIEPGLVEVVQDAPPPAEETSPLLSRMELRRDWPPHPGPGLRDELFEEGWGRAADDLASGAATTDALLGRLDEADRPRALALIAEQHDEVETLRKAAADPDRVRVFGPAAISATDYVRLRSGEVVEAELTNLIPLRPSAARSTGTVVHRLIEERCRDLGWIASSYPEEAELDEPSAEEPDGGAQQALDVWEQRFGGRTPARLASGEPMIELPFTVKVAGRLVRGRIDAVFTDPEVELEIVDWKTGEPIRRTEPDQLAVYAAALTRLGVDVGERIRLTYFYTSSGETDSRVVVVDDLAGVLT